MQWRIVLVAAVSLLTCACRGRVAPAITSDDPGKKIPGIKRAVREKDLSAARQMVEDLDSDDPAVRFYAIMGLRRLTGENFGYQYFGDREQRRPAVLRWRQWLAEQVGPNQ